MHESPQVAADIAVVLVASIVLNDEDDENDEIGDAETIASASQALVLLVDSWKHFLKCGMSDVFQEWLKEK